MVRYLFACGLVICVAAAALAQDQRKDTDERLTKDLPTSDSFEQLHAMLKRQRGESRWMEIDWYPSVWEGRQRAAAEGKPIFIWAGSGGAPAAGC